MVRMTSSGSSLPSPRPWKSSANVICDRVPPSSGSTVMLALALSGPSTLEAAQLLGTGLGDLLRQPVFDAADPASGGEPRAYAGRVASLDAHAHDVVLPLGEPRGVGGICEDLRWRTGDLDAGHQWWHCSSSSPLSSCHIGWC